MSKWRGDQLWREEKFRSHSCAAYTLHQRSLTRHCPTVWQCGPSPSGSMESVWVLLSVSLPKGYFFLYFTPKAMLRMLPTLYTANHIVLWMSAMRVFLQKAAIVYCLLTNCNKHVYTVSWLQRWGGRGNNITIAVAMSNKKKNVGGYTRQITVWK